MTKTTSNNKETHSDDTEIVGAEKEFSIGSKMDAVLGNHGEFDTTPIFDPAQLDLEKFMHDELTVVFNDPPGESDTPYAEVTVNGHRLVFARSSENPVKMPRKHVEALTHAKFSRVKQEKVVGPDGSMNYVDKFVTTLAYQFAVISDPSRFGREWLKRNIAMAG
jgi:hypothetical protein